MDHRHIDLLDTVIAALEARKLVRVAQDTGIPYDTVLRIKNREGDPRYSRVKALYLYLFAPPPGVASEKVV